MTPNEELDSRVVDLRCPNPNGCSATIKEKIGRLKMEPKLKCRTCGIEFSLDHKQVRELVAAVEKAIADAKRKLGGK